jgi:hypothetical protein
MPLDVLGRTRATLICSASISESLRSATYLSGDGGRISKANRAGDRPLQLLVLNEEFLVNARHQRALITSLPFVHTARRCYRLNGLVSSGEWLVFYIDRELDQT